MAEQGRRGPHVAQRLEPGARVVRGVGEIGEKRLGVDDVLSRGAGLLQRAEDRIHRVPRLPVEIALALDEPTGAERGGAGDEHAIAHAHRPRVRVLFLDGAPGPDAARRGAGAVDSVQLDLDQLLGARQPADLDERGRRPRVAQIPGECSRRRVGERHIRDVDTASHDVGELAPRLAHAPFGDGHDRLDLLGDVVDSAHVAGPIDRRRARLKHRVADPQGAGVVGQLLERSSRCHVDSAIRRHHVLPNQRNRARS